LFFSLSVYPWHFRLDERLAKSRNRNGISEAFEGLGEAFNGGAQYEAPLVQQVDRPGPNSTWRGLKLLQGA
jgi:hypothetical protein